MTKREYQYWFATKRESDGNFIIAVYRGEKMVRRVHLHVGGMFFWCLDGKNLTPTMLKQLCEKAILSRFFCKDEGKVQSIRKYVFEKSCSFHGNTGKKGWECPFSI